MNRASAAATAGTLALVLLPAAAGAAPAVAAKKPPKPPLVGHWSLSNIMTGNLEIARSGFTVTKHDADVARIGIKPGAQAEPGCGTGTLFIAGKHRLFDAKGINPEGEAYSEWAVGHNKPSADPVIQPSKVTLHQSGKAIPGYLFLVFSSPKGGTTSGGELTFGQKRADGGCDIQFLMKKA